MKPDISEIVSFNVFAKVRTNIAADQIFYDLSVRSSQGNEILCLEKKNIRPHEGDFIIGPHKTKSIAYGASYNYQIKVMLYRKVGDQFYEVRKTSYIVPFHLTEFLTLEPKPKILLWSIDYFESKELLKKPEETVEKLVISEKKLEYQELNTEYKIFSGFGSKSFSITENVGIHAAFSVKGEIVLKNKELKIVADGRTNAGKAANATITWFVNAELLLNNKRFSHEMLRKNPSGYLSDPDADDWSYKPIGEVSIRLPEPKIGQDIVVKIRARYLMTKPTGEGFSPSSEICHQFNLYVIKK